MTDLLFRLRRFLAELKRRKAYQVGATCLVVVAFVGIQTVNLLLPDTTLPSWTDGPLLAFLIVGSPVAVAWAFGLSSEGVRRTEPAGIGEASGEKGMVARHARRAFEVVTHNGARVLGVDEVLVTLEEAEPADLVLIDGNPRENAGDIRNVTTVFGDGVGYDSAGLVETVRGVVGTR